MSNNVVDFKKKPATAAEEVSGEVKTVEETDFEAIAKANKEKQARMERDRLDANKKVLRNYRIKQ